MFGGMQLDPNVNGEESNDCCHQEHKWDAYLLRSKLLMEIKDAFLRR